MQPADPDGKPDPRGKDDLQSTSKAFKKTERQDKISEVKKKDGSVVMVRKFKKKKRFGKSINRRAPSLFLTELERKITTTGGVYEEVKTETFKASQYDHSTDEYKTH